MASKKATPSFGDLVRQHREKKSLTFRDAEADSGVNKGAILRVEQGKTPSLENFCSLVLWTGMPMRQALETFRNR